MDNVRIASNILFTLHNVSVITEFVLRNQSERNTTLLKKEDEIVFFSDTKH